MNLRSESCPNCGMHVADHPVAFSRTHGFYTVEGPVVHECPEPLPRDIAEPLLEAIIATGATISGRLKAQLRLAL